ncbi:MAG: hypothetical protein U9R79_05335 [Armatimonadota bacterium]|nr:hypothetical protein [Armatimonadota bacterium]
MMTPAELMCAQVVTLVCEGLFLAGAALVWRALYHMRINGACQLGLGLLVVLRVSAAASTIGGPPQNPLTWTWLTEVLFSFSFLYLLYHMGALVSACRR